MVGFSFDTFEVTDENRAAAALAQRVAALAYDGPRPVLLVGPHGSGKSHLLWAIVKQVRSGPVRAGLALIFADEFPDKVRQLAGEPGPIRQGRPALLLVDGLDEFRTDAADLEAVVSVFLTEGHQVVLASREAPARLTQFTPGFRQLLEQGAAAALAPAPGAPRPASSEVSEMQAALEAAIAERDALRERAERAEHRAAAMEHVAHEARAEAEEAFAQQARLQGQLSAFKLAAGEADSLRAELEAARADIERLRAAGEIAAAGDSRGGSGSADAELSEARALAQALRAQLAQERNRFETELTEIQAECDLANELLAEARSEQGRLGVALDGARGRLAAIEQELETARRQWSAHAQELEALRRAAAAQVASATMQAGELEHRVVQLQSALETARSAGRRGLEQTQRFLPEFLRAAEGMQRVAESLHMIAALSVVSEIAAAPARHPELFESLPPEFAPGRVEDNGRGAAAPDPPARPAVETW